MWCDCGGGEVFSAQPDPEQQKKVEPNKVIKRAGQAPLGELLMPGDMRLG